MSGGICLFLSFDYILMVLIHSVLFSLFLSVALSDFIMKNDLYIRFFIFYLLLLVSALVGGFFCVFVSVSLC